jgi:hypothetical protein
MLQNEFIERGGNVEDYNIANCLYMMATAMNKDEFCEVWKKIKKSPKLYEFVEDAVDGYSRERKASNQAVKDLNEQIRQCQEIIAVLNDRLRAVGDDYEDMRRKYNDRDSLVTRLGIVIAKSYTPDMDNVLELHLTPSEIVKMKLTHNLPLSDKDRAYIAEHI